MWVHTGSLIKISSVYISWYSYLCLISSLVCRCRRTIIQHSYAPVISPKALLRINYQNTWQVGSRYVKLLCLFSPLTESRQGKQAAKITSCCFIRKWRRGSKIAWKRSWLVKSKHYEVHLVFEVKAFLCCCRFALASLEVFRWDIARNSLSNVSYSFYNNQWLLKKFKAEGSFSMRYPNALSVTVVDFAFSCWIKFISERNDSLWLMANKAFWLPCHCTFGTCKFSSHESKAQGFCSL